MNYQIIKNKIKKKLDFLDKSTVSDENFSIADYRKSGIERHFYTIDLEKKAFLNIGRRSLLVENSRLVLNFLRKDLAKAFFEKDFLLRNLNKQSPYLQEMILEIEEIYTTVEKDYQRLETKIKTLIQKLTLYKDCDLCFKKSKKKYLNIQEILQSGGRAYEKALKINKNPDYFDSLNLELKNNKASLTHLTEYFESNKLFLMAQNSELKYLQFLKLEEKLKKLRDRAREIISNNDISGEILTKTPKNIKRINGLVKSLKKAVSSYGAEINSFKSIGDASAVLTVFKQKYRKTGQLIESQRKLLNYAYKIFKKYDNLKHVLTLKARLKELELLKAYYEALELDLEAGEKIFRSSKDSNHKLDQARIQYAALEKKADSLINVFYDLNIVFKKALNRDFGFGLFEIERALRYAENLKSGEFEEFFEKLDRLFKQRAALLKDFELLKADVKTDDFLSEKFEILKNYIKGPQNLFELAEAVILSAQAEIGALFNSLIEQQTTAQNLSPAAFRLLLILKDSFLTKNLKTSQKYIIVSQFLREFKILNPKQVKI
ncbi:MAG: hypothetical protein GF347_01745 [Candidatus Moranbacteria bacterium]|nr:hypothetical protein [Candidatus Moranbacteria bacterium]